MRFRTQVGLVNNKTFVAIGKYSSTGEIFIGNLDMTSFNFSPSEQIHLPGNIFVGAALLPDKNVIAAVSYIFDAQFFLSIYDLAANKSLCCSC